MHGFAQGVLYAADFCDLASDVEMNKLQAVGHVVLLKERKSVEKFGGIEAEFADIAARLFPFSGAGRGELDSNTYCGGDIEAFRDFRDQPQLVELLDNEEDAAPHFLGKQRELDIILIFISVADDDGVFVGVDGEDGMQFRF